MMRWCGSSCWGGNSNRNNS